jgi:serine acetyltransferase
MATILELGGVRPTIGKDVWLAPTAVLAGDVRIGDRASVWFGAVPGVPAAERMPLSGTAQRWTETAAAEYQEYRRRYQTSSVVIEGG